VILIIKRPRLNALWFVIVLGVLLRAAMIVAVSGRLDDPDNYLALARSLSQGRGFQLDGRLSAYRPPLYPLMLAPLVRMPQAAVPAGIGVFHLGLAAATIWLTARAAQGSGLSRGRCLLAAAITAFDPVLVAQCRFVMTETPAAFLVAASLAAFCAPGRAAPAAGGAVLGLAALCRPSLLAGAGIACAAALLACPGTMRQRLMRTILIAPALGLVLAPWAVRNTLVFGEPVWTTTHGGYTLALANNPTYYRDVLDGPPGSVWTGHQQWLWWDSVNRQTAGMSEPEADRFLRDSVYRLAREHPAQFARAAEARLIRFWSIAPAHSVYPAPVRWATMVWTVPLWLALFFGLVQPMTWRWPTITAPAYILGLTLVHAFFWTDLRMRAPIMPAIALVSAAAGVTWPRLRPVLRGS
jgi:hypothetical protein